MKNEAPTEQKLLELNEKIDKAVAHWHDIYENGCNDPFWEDGCNLELVRNHIIWYLREIAELQQQPMQTSLFDIAFMEVDPLSDPRIPPEVPHKYMARERVVFGKLLAPSERPFTF